MATQKNKVEWEFLLNQRQLDRGLQKTKRGFQDTKRSSDTLNTAMGGLKTAAGALGLAFGAREILQFGQDAIKSASDYNESVNAMELTTGFAAAAITELGESADEAMGLSKTAVNEAAVAFSAFGSQIDQDGDISDTFEDYITRAGDFASVMNIDVNDALRIFQSTLSGESEPIRRFGIDLSAAAVEAFALSEGIIEVGETMSAEDKVLARYGLLMQDTAQVQGDFANTSGEVANAQRIATAEMENARIELGTRLLPLQAKWVDVQRTLATVLSNTVDAFDDMNKEQELQSRLMFKSLKDAGKVTGHWEDWGRAQSEAADSSNALSGAWDILVGRTSDLDRALEEVTAETSAAVVETEKLSLAELQARDAYIKYAEGMNAINSATEDVVETTGDLISIVGDAELAAMSVEERLRTLNSLSMDRLRREWQSVERTADRYRDAVLESLQLTQLLSGQSVNTSFTTPGGQTGLAKGGTLSPGQTSLVGEEGPEIITAGSSMRVHPNGTVPGGGGGVGTTVNIYVDALDPDAAAVAVADAIRSYEDRYGSIR